MQRLHHVPRLLKEAHRGLAAWQQRQHDQEPHRCLGVVASFETCHAVVGWACHRTESVVGAPAEVCALLPAPRPEKAPTHPLHVYQARKKARPPVTTHLCSVDAHQASIRCTQTCVERTNPKYLHGTAERNKPIVTAARTDVRLEYYRNVLGGNVHVYVRPHSILNNKHQRLHPRTAGPSSSA